MKKRPLQTLRHFAGKGLVTGTFLFATLALSVAAADNKTLTGHVPGVVNKLALPATGRPPATSQLSLAIGLPLHDKAALNRLIDLMYDPTSGNYHQFLTPEQLTQRFGPTEQEYAAVIQFAEANGLTVFAKHGNRMLLDVSGQVSDIEKAFHVTLHTYQHPTEARQFFAPDVEPTVDASLPILNVSGLDNYALPHPNYRLGPSAAQGASGASSGSGPGGSYRGYDFRNAYAPGVSLTGSGQIVGLFEMDGYYLSDITTYESQSGISPQVPMENVLMDGLSGTPANKDAVGEVSLDIEMAIAMAPGLSKVVVFEGNNWDDILNSMAARSEIKQLSCSWGYTGATSASQDNIFLLMAAEGQSFFLASGDGDAFTGDLMAPDDDPHITTVGGTTLTMTGSGASYSSEHVWNWGYDPPAWWYGGGGYWGSSGGISTRTSIPIYQQGISMASNGGSTIMRNVPDVALTADGVYVIYWSGSTGTFGGTSCAAPLWAGFMALVNQQAAANGQPSVGFVNPALYQIAKGSSYNSCFHDINTGNSTSAGSPSNFYAVSGYDLATGLGTPNGSSMINALMPYSGAVWVDYNYTGSTQNGSYDAPYKTFAQAVTAVSASGNVWFKSSGSKLETMTVTKAMNLNSLNGAATIGK